MKHLFAKVVLGTIILFTVIFLVIFILYSSDTVIRKIIVGTFAVIIILIVAIMYQVVNIRSRSRRIRYKIIRTQKLTSCIRYPRILPEYSGSIELFLNSAIFLSGMRYLFFADIADIKNALQFNEEIQLDHMNLLIRDPQRLDKYYSILTKNLNDMIRILDVTQEERDVSSLFYLTEVEISLILLDSIKYLYFEFIKNTYEDTIFNVFASIVSKLASPSMNTMTLISSFLEYLEMSGVNKVLKKYKYFTIMSLKYSEMYDYNTKKVIKFSLINLDNYKSLTDIYNITSENPLYIVLIFPGEDVVGNAKNIKYFMLSEYRIRSILFHNVEIHQRPRQHIKIVLFSDDIACLVNLSLDEERIKVIKLPDNRNILEVKEIKDFIAYNFVIKAILYEKSISPSEIEYKAPTSITFINLDQEMVNFKSQFVNIFNKLNLMNTQDIEGYKKLFIDSYYDTKKLSLILYFTIKLSNAINNHLGKAEFGKVLHIPQFLGERLNKYLRMAKELNSKLQNTGNISQINVKTCTKEYTINVNKLLKDSLVFMDFFVITLHNANLTQENYYDFILGTIYLILLLFKFYLAFFNLKNLLNASGSNDSDEFLKLIRKFNRIIYAKSYFRPDSTVEKDDDLDVLRKEIFNNIKTLINDQINEIHDIAEILNEIPVKITMKRLIIFKKIIDMNDTLKKLLSKIISVGVDESDMTPNRFPRISNNESDIKEDTFNIFLQVFGDIIKKKEILSKKNEEFRKSYEKGFLMSLDEVKDKLDELESRLKNMDPESVLEEIKEKFKTMPGELEGKIKNIITGVGNLEETMKNQEDIIKLSDSKEKLKKLSEFKEKLKKLSEEIKDKAKQIEKKTTKAEIIQGLEEFKQKFEEPKKIFEVLPTKIEKLFFSSITIRLFFPPESDEEIVKKVIEDVGKKDKRENLNFYLFFLQTYKIRQSSGLLKFCEILKNKENIIDEIKEAVTQICDRQSLMSIPSSLMFYQFEIDETAKEVNPNNYDLDSYISNLLSGRTNYGNMFMLNDRHLSDLYKTKEYWKKLNENGILEKNVGIIEITNEDNLIESLMTAPSNLISRLNAFFEGNSDLSDEELKKYIKYSISAIHVCVELLERTYEQSEMGLIVPDAEVKKRLNNIKKFIEELQA